jgi:8-hydroxy-5-deazaflavin:NADPH oxidoreductase
MKIGILGVGFIGATLVRKLSAAGHQVFVANSRDPKSIQELAHEAGATAVTAREAVKDVDVIILSVPYAKIPALRSLLTAAPENVPIIDTSNYYPLRDGHIQSVDEGQLESEWVAEQLGRPVTKAWNAVLAGTLRKNGKKKGANDRTAIPVAGDDTNAKQIAMKLVDETGFDPVDAGSIAESWRQQTGNPAYCTELTVAQLKTALSIADRSLANKRRDLGMEIVLTYGEEFNNDDLLKLNRAIMRFPK